jgi:hypothetical protein
MLEDFFSEPDVDTSQYVWHNRPSGIKCTNFDCPYNDIAYEQDKNRWQHPDDGLCLNCIDDLSRYVEDSEFYERQQK